MYLNTELQPQPRLICLKSLLIKLMLFNFDPGSILVSPGIPTFTFFRGNDIQDKVC